MRTAIVGAGNAGKDLAAKLCEMHQDVVVIDNNAAALKDVSSNHDVMTFEGSGSDPSVFNRGEIGKTDLLAAVTPHDEINILACSWAKAAGVRHTVSRLSDSKYMRSPYVDLNAMGIDRPVIHKEECAKEIFDVLYRPGTMEVTSLLNGKIAAIGLKLPETTPLAQSHAWQTSDRVLMRSGPCKTTPIFHWQGKQS